MPLEINTSPFAGAGGLIGTVRIQDAFTNAQAVIGQPNQDGLGWTGLNQLLTTSQGTVFNGLNFDRIRSASAANLIAQTGVGAALVAPPGNWSGLSSPAPNVQASASRAAGGAGVRHVATSALVSLFTTAVGGPAAVSHNIRDGASGIGSQFHPVGIIGVDNVVGHGEAVPISGLSQIGSAATAMTYEFQTAAGGGVQESVSFGGYDAS